MNTATSRGVFMLKTYAASRREPHGGANFFSFSLAPVQNQTGFSIGFTSEAVFFHLFSTASYEAFDGAVREAVLMRI